MAWQRLGNEMLDITSEINDKVKDTKTNRRNNNKARTRILKNSSDLLVSKTDWTSHQVLWFGVTGWPTLHLFQQLRRCPEGPENWEGMDSIHCGVVHILYILVKLTEKRQKSKVMSSQYESHCQLKIRIYLGFYLLSWEMYGEWSKHPCGGGNTDWSSYNVCQRKTSQSNTYSSLYPAIRL